MNEKLVVTNYDNFKNAEFFIQQYFEAEERMKNIQEFFQSFYMSKLIHSEDVYKLKPNYVVFSEYDFSSHSWFKELTNHDLNLNPYCQRTYDKNKEIDIEKLNKLLNEISMRLRGDWACYFVLDSNNVLHEFIPVAAKDTIKITINKNEICISGHYFYGFQSNGSFGQAQESISKITRTIIIDPSNNNVLKIKTSDRYLSTKKLSNHLSSHECYTHAWVDKDADCELDTFNYINPYEEIEQYIEDNYATYYKGYIRKIYYTAGSSSSQGKIYLAKNQEELDSIYEDIIEHKKDIFMKMFGVELTKEHLNRFNYMLRLRDDAIKESYKYTNGEDGSYEKMKTIPEDNFPLISWYKCNTHKNLLEENDKENR